MASIVQSLPQAGSYLPIEDHGIIGDLHTVALVGNNGTIDWCCMPAFDAPSIFAAYWILRKAASSALPHKPRPK
jgi:GH15 family glucan-1,4-alpha-glucosidase